MATQDERRRAAQAGRTVQARQLQQAAPRTAQQTALQTARQTARQTALQTARQTAPQTTGTAALQGVDTAQADAAANRGTASFPRLSDRSLTADWTAGTAGTSAGTGTAALRAQLDQAQRQNQVSTLDRNTLQGWMDRYGQIRDNAVQQQAAQIDYGVRQGTSQLRRTLEDAQEQYDSVSNQIAADAARARDNQALYAAARGDRGGIGAAQYDSISNTAMAQQREVNNARVKLTTDVMRQIEDLRAQGEFQKADAVFDAAQDYLRQLQQLEQYAREYNLNAEQFNAQMRQQALSYAMQLEQMDVNRGQWLEEMAFQRSRAERSDYENDRNFGFQQDRAARSDYESDRNYNRAVLENDRNYDFQVGRAARSDYENDRNYNRSVLESDRNFSFQQNRAARSDYENDRNFGFQQNRAARSDYENDRNFGFQQNRAARSDYENDRNFGYQQSQDTRTWAWREQDRADSQAQQAFANDLALRQVGSAERQQNLENALTAAKLEQAEQERRTELGWNILKAGILPDAETLRAMGIGENEASLYASAAQQGLIPSGGGSSGGTQNMTRYTAEGMAKNGQWTDTVYNALLRGGYTAQDIALKYGDSDGYKAYMRTRSGGTGTAGTANTAGRSTANANAGNYGKNYTSIWNNVRAMWDGGRNATKNMTPEQRREYIVKYLDQQSEENLTQAGVEYILSRLGAQREA